MSTLIGTWREKKCFHGFVLCDSLTRETGNWIWNIFHAKQVVSHWGMGCLSGGFNQRPKLLWKSQLSSLKSTPCPSFGCILIGIEQLREFIMIMCLPGSVSLHVCVAKPARVYFLLFPQGYLSLASTSKRHKLSMSAKTIPAWHQNKNEPWNAFLDTVSFIKIKMLGCHLYPLR